ncbi:hypothetical protein BGZ63DRAFT_269631 [Mariannaea sp. PMI_226]|nr:hypothetical protein BGZ63DRAFT_269631 [Mariannaea sp. PMI_226]
MPGVPSGKGCDACRKQKKKCDQAKPACSRCSRLSIPCVGGGQQRYKFKVQVLDTESTGLVKSAVGKKARSSRSPCAPEITVMPLGRTHAITGVFISRLAVTDLRFDIFTYGTFLRYIPQRIGTNEALDAATDLFSSSLSTLYSKSPTQGVEVYSKYGAALKAVRDSLNDPTRGQTTETMCAIYMIMVAQGWIGRPENMQVASHAEGLAHLLKAMASQDWHGNFEMEMLVTMCVPVVMESIINPRIELFPWFNKILEKFREPDGPPHPDYETVKILNPDIFSSLTMTNLARFPGYLTDPVGNHLDLLSAYHMLRIDSQKLLRKCSQITELDMMIRPGMSYERIQHGMRVAYNMTLALGLILNTLLQEFDPSDTSLATDSQGCIDEIIRDAEQAGKYRPLGSSHVGLALSMAWAVCDDVELKAYMMSLLVDYNTDFTCSDWVKMAHWWKMKLSRVRRTIAEHLLGPGIVNPWPTPESEPEMVHGNCSSQ